MTVFILSVDSEMGADQCEQCDYKFIRPGDLQIRTKVGGICTNLNCNSDQ